MKLKEAEAQLNLISELVYYDGLYDGGLAECQSELELKNKIN